MDLASCEIRTRVSPRNDRNDYWWEMDDDSGREIAELAIERAEPYFDSYEIKTAIAPLRPEDLLQDTPEILSSLTLVRRYLLLARVNEYLGDSVAAREFANLGLSVAGMAVGPKRQLKEIINRLS